MRAVGLLLSTLLIGCGPRGPALPQNRPAGLKVRYHKDRGRIPEGSSMKLGPAGGEILLSYHAARPRIENRIRFEMRAGAWDALYAVMRDNQFAQIEKAEGIAYDKGGVSLRVDWDGKSHGQSSSGGFIKKAHRTRWRTIVDAIERIITAQLKEHLVEHTLVVDESLTGQWLQVNINHPTVFVGEVKGPMTRTLRRVAGRYELRAHTGKGPTGGRSARVQLEIGKGSGEPTRTTVSLRDGKLVIERRSP